MKDNPRMFNVQFGNILGLSIVIISSENKVKTPFKNFLRSSYLPPNSRMIFNILCKNASEVQRQKVRLDKYIYVVFRRQKGC